MALVRSFTGERREPLGGWERLATAPDAFSSPAGLPPAGWTPFETPGTVAGALRRLGRLTDEAAAAIDRQDHWLRARLDAALNGRLAFEGLATLCEIWLNGEKRAESRAMFAPVAVEAELRAGAEVALCFRALEPKLAAAPKRSRWRPQMIQPNGLRFFRTTALGSTPGWSPAGRPTGPWRPITRTDGKPAPKVDVRATYDDGVGRLVVTIDVQTVDSREGGRGGVVTCAGEKAEFSRGEDGRRTAALTLPGVAPWFPHTHGEPALHRLTIELDGETLDLGRVGFRSIEVDRGADGEGFGLVVNGVPVFCRGACWSSADAIALAGSREAYEPWLRLAAGAGMNMIRVPGVMAYETDDFFDLCDELGLMVWQEAMLANFDYPQADPVFRAEIAAEAEAFLDRTQTHPSLAVFCGGSEVFQQAAMLGAPPEVWSGPVFDEILPGALARLRPDIPYVPNSPSGGPLPFSVDRGVSHYYGVGAYLRPLDDARRANVRFASECLAFANMPEDVSLARAGLAAAFDAADWKRGVPRDMGASWDFEDVRDHYVERLYGVATSEMKRADPERYLALSRAATAEVMEATFAEFRRPGSPTRGALVWLLQDLTPGAGWGVIASDGEPKSAWHALKRAFRPVQLSVTDEGLNGLALHLVNERPVAFEGAVSLTCWRDGATPVVQAKATVRLAPREASTLSAYDVIGRFFDIAYAYRFGPPGHDATSVTLTDAAGAVVAEAFHFPLGRGSTQHALGLAARLDGDDLVVSAERFAQSVHIVDDNARPSENWFHLAPGHEKRVKRLPRSTGSDAPRGLVRAVNGLDDARYGPA